MLKQQASRIDYNYKEWYVDSVTDIPNLDVSDACQGSVVYVLRTQDVYILNKNRQWVKQTEDGGSSPSETLPMTAVKENGVTTITYINETGSHTVEIYDGITPVKGTDYFTNAEINEFTNTITTNVTNNIGIIVDGINGEVI